MIRNELGTVLGFIRPGETLAVARIGRPARSPRDLQAIVAKLGERDAPLPAAEQPADASRPKRTETAYMDI